MAKHMIERSVQWRLSLQVAGNRADNVDSASALFLQFYGVDKVLNMHIVGEPLPRRIRCSAKISHSPKPPMYEPPSVHEKPRSDTGARDQLPYATQLIEQGQLENLLLYPVGQVGPDVSASHTSTANVNGSCSVDADGGRQFLWGEGMSTSLGRRVMDGLRMGYCGGCLQIQ